MGAAYSFVSRWSVPASADRCWDEIERMLRPGADVSWWPGVSIVTAPAAIAPGESVALTVRSPLGYRLRAHLTITQVDPGRLLAAESAGDLRGAGRIEITQAAAGAASVDVCWDVSTERAWMNATAFALRPLFELAHERVMARGERGLRVALEGA